MAARIKPLVCGDDEPLWYGMPPKKKVKPPIEKFIDAYGSEVDWKQPGDILETDLHECYASLLKDITPCPPLPSTINEVTQDHNANGKKAASRETTPSNPNGASRNKTAKCSSIACLEKPDCLNWLGQELWENEGKGFRSTTAVTSLTSCTDKALKVFLKRNGLHYDPHEDCRDWTVPVGLKVSFTFARIES
jgi:hypothetical protein